MSFQRSGETGFLTRVFLRDCAFLMWLYGRSDSRWLWSYGVLAFSVTLGSFATLVFFAVATLLPELFPTALHPATASKEVLWIEGIVIYVGVGAWTDYRFRVFRDTVASVAGRYCTRSDRFKWCLTSLFGTGCIVGIALLAVAMHR